MLLKLFDALYDALSEPAAVSFAPYPLPKATHQPIPPPPKNLNTTHIIQVGFGAECLAVVAWAVLACLARALLFALRLEALVPHALLFANPVLLQVRRVEIS